MQERIRLFVRDALEAAFVTLGAVVFVAPTNLDDAKRQALILGAAIASAVYAVVRRELFPIILDAIAKKG
jgi:hypothetical protein